jgi:large subunit ribosomal protein L15
MKLHHLRPAEGSTRPRKRVGRGRAAGQGKTAGRGTKGTGARHSSTSFLGFEGGQMPLQRRVPKLKGFTNPNRVEYQVLNVVRLGQLFEARAEVTPEILAQRRLVRPSRPVKILGQGEIDRPLTVRAHAVSQSARRKIEQAGGTVEILPA